MTRFGCLVLVALSASCGSGSGPGTGGRGGAGDQGGAGGERKPPDALARSTDSGLADTRAPAADAAIDATVVTAAADTGNELPTAADASGACTPDPSGVLAASGEVVFDPRTCLSWTRATKEGVNLNPALPPDGISHCGQLVLGGHDDWRVPTVDELASIITRCGKYPPEGPWDPLFEVKGDGYWTTTSAGAPRKVCAIGTANAGKFYEYGIDGPQVVRCVRGAGTVRHARDCTTGATCSNWYQ
jgi:hypothetical protein